MWRAIFTSITTMVILMFILVAVTYLSGCSRIEGAGFTNGGVERPPACIKSRKGNVEVWGNC
jgi:hypothetical protein